MSFARPLLTSMQRAVKDALGSHWRLLMFQGVSMVILGCLAIAAPVTATVAVDLYVGWLFALGGVIGLVAIVSTHDVPAFLWSLLTAALSIVAGIMSIAQPLEGALSLTLVLTAFFTAEGVFQVATSIAYRNVIAASWVWMLVSGLADLAMAGIIIANWPASAVWVLGLLAGINLISSGWAIVMAAMAGREFARDVAPSAEPAHRK
ncbi:HdeD family acid-resistance protein [Bradyrhizobium genosp. A]|uniref:HdeD family acid-resistance protein n=1 Tax=Bradyrhizobium genosp. A TaxID=83626 RepID=UPI003CEA0AFD